MIKKQDKKSRKKAKLDECAQLKACCCCCCGSLPCLKDPHDDPNYVSKVYNTRLIGYDDYGNLRYKIDPAHVGDDELSQILALDSTNRDGRDLWYVIDACWVNEWLLFAHTDKIVAPSPGPVYNKRLLMTDQETGKLVPNRRLQTCLARNMGAICSFISRQRTAYHDVFPLGNRCCGSRSSRSQEQSQC